MVVEEGSDDSVPEENHIAGSPRHQRLMSDLTNDEVGLVSEVKDSIDPSAPLSRQEMQTAVSSILEDTKAPRTDLDPWSARITLDDLTPTLDQQAEAVMMDVLEKKERKMRLREVMRNAHRSGNYANEGSQVLQGISEEAVHLFLSQQELEDTKPSEGKKVAFQEARFQDELSPQDLHHQNRTGQINAMNDTSPPPPIRDTHAVQTSPPRSGRKGFANLVSDMQRAQNGENRPLERFKSSSQLSRHATLRSMSSVRSKMDSTHKSERSTTDSITKPKPKNSQVSDTDMFYKNAAVLYQLNNTDATGSFGAKDSDDHATEVASLLRQRSARPQSGWGSVKAVVHMGVHKQESTENNTDQDHLPVAGVVSRDSSFDIEAADNNHKDDESPFTRSGNLRAKNKSGFKRYLTFLKFRLQNVFQFQKNSYIFLKYAKLVFVFLAVPLIGLAALLYYALGNPLATKTGGSVSWWLILTFRWILTFSMAKFVQFILLDCLALRSSIMLRSFGPVATLTLVQSKGWPFQVVAWSLFNFGMLFGNRPFVLHWFYYQDLIGMFNASNPAGTFLTNKVYLSLLIAGVVVGTLSALKRAAVSLYLGRRTCEFYGPQLEKIMEKLILVSAVAQLAKEIELESGIDITRVLEYGHLSRAASPFYVLEKNMFHTKRGKSDSDLQKEDSDDESTTSDDDHLHVKSKEINIDNNNNESNIDSNTGTTIKNQVSEKSIHSLRDKLDSGVSKVSLTSASRHAENTKNLISSNRYKMLRLLDSWEEPVNVGDSQFHEDVSIKEILQFRHALGQIDVTHPFSRAFGLAGDRKSCVESAQEVFKRLLLHTPDETSIPFETISIVGLDDYGDLEEAKTKDLVKIFRPGADGKLSMLDFVKSCDAIYREFRTFRAAVANSSILNNAYEKIIDGVFYFLMGVLILLIFELDVWTLLVSISSLVVSFAFAFGAAVSKFTEGVLLVTVRKPFDIGDRIHISRPENDTAPDGSMAWFVENITLYATTVRFAATNEVATIANGNLANTRIINAARSPRMVCSIYMKFGINVPFEKLQFFRETLEEFIKARPREWIQLCAFRLTKMHADLGFVEYVLVLQHREPWQNIVAMLNAKAEASSFCLEVSKKLNMRYVAPPLPIKLGFDEDSPMELPLMMPLQPSDKDVPLPIHKKTNTMDNSEAAVRLLHDLFAPKKKDKSK